MRPFRDHLILSESTLKEALFRLNHLGEDTILFVVNNQDQLIGSLTDGDVRRGLLKDFTINDTVDKITKSNTKFINKGEKDIKKLIKYRNSNYRILPILDEDKKIINLINFRILNSLLPIEVVIMAGGRGERLKPLTDFTPKPLLKIGGKPIIEWNLDRLINFGIDNFWISVNYLGKQIESYLGNGGKLNIDIKYIWEKAPLGTIGAVSLINTFSYDYVLVTNSDILTNIDYEHFFLDFINSDADLAVMTIPYQVSVPYAVLETKDKRVKNFKEKPIYTYNCNGGVYLMKKEILKHIPYNTFYNATDLIEKLINENYKVVSYPFLGYWLDIGKHDDFKKAQIDIKNFK